MIILSMYCREEYILEAFEAGVMAFLPKEVSVTELAETIRTVLKGESVLSPKITRQLLEFCQRLKQGDGESAAPTLTHQHVQVLRLAGCGYGNKEIADRMGISVNTVKREAEGIVHAPRSPRPHPRRHHGIEAGPVRRRRAQQLSSAPAERTRGGARSKGSSSTRMGTSIPDRV